MKLLACKKPSKFFEFCGSKTLPVFSTFKIFDFPQPKEYIKTLFMS